MQQPQMQPTVPMQAQPPPNPQYAYSAQPNVVVQLAPVPPRIRENYPQKQAMFLGVSQLLIGILCFLFQVIAIAVEAYASFVGAGIWCSIFFILAGAFGIVSAKKRTACWIVSCMVFSILSAVFTIPILASSAAGISYDKDDYRYRYDYHYDYYYTTRRPYSQYTSRAAMNGILICLALLEAGAAIWASVICCAGVCCGASATPGHVVQYQGGLPYFGQQTVVMGQQPPMVVYQTTPGQPQTYIIQQGHTQLAPNQVAPQQYAAGQMGSPPPYNNIPAAPADQGQYQPLQPEPGKN